MTRRLSSTPYSSGLHQTSLGLTLWLLIPMAACIEYTDLYSFPMVGLLQYKFEVKQTNKSYVTYGTVSMIHDVVFLAAAENLCQLDPTRAKYIFREDQRDKLYVTMASDMMEPPDLYLPETHDILRVKVHTVYFGKNSDFAADMRDDTLKSFGQFRKKWIKSTAPAPNLDGKRFLGIRKFGFELNPFGELQWDVAFIVVSSPLPFGPYILPIPNHDWRDSTIRREFNIAWNRVARAEAIPLQYASCVVPGWSPLGTNVIVYHKVVYVRFKECAEAICGAYPSTCLNYLNERHHVCFKSTSYADSCVVDQGAPVLCPWPSTRIEVIGILVKTWDCGTEGLPTVFTRLDTVQAFGSLAIGSLWRNLSTLSPDIIHDPKYTLQPIG